MLNVDSSSLENPDRTGFGGLLRQGDGESMQGFYGSLSVADSLKDEPVAILQGLSLACGARKVVCYLDSITALSVATKCATMPSVLGSQLLVEATRIRFQRDTEQGLRTLRFFFFFPFVFE